MKVSGFTLVRNAVKYDYPIAEAITSVLPLCDDFVVNVGKCDDGTLELVRSISSPKIKIFESEWNDHLREGGKLLAVETNKAFDQISSDSNWAVYIQADEVLHEKFLEITSKGMRDHKEDEDVEGLLFKYIHFYGNYNYVGNSRRWYRNEVRIIKNDNRIRSYRDAMGFRKSEKKLKVKPLDACLYHYGWVKPPDAQQAKQKTFHKLWHNDKKAAALSGEEIQFDYSNIDGLEVFKGSHPGVMKKRIERLNWNFNYDPSKNKLSLKNSFLKNIENFTGWRPGEYKNYQLLT